MVNLNEQRLFSRDNLLIVSLACSVMTIPLHNNLNSWALVFFCTVGFIHAMINPAKIKPSGLAILSACFFIWMSLTFFWDRFGFSIKNIEQYSAFLFLPFMLSIIPKLSPKVVQIICFAFVISTTAITLICLVKSMLEYQSTGDYRVFFYHYLSGQMGLNAIFLSNYCVEAIVWLLYFRFINPQGLNKPGNLVTIMWCIYLFAVVIILSSKMLIFLLFITLIFFLLYIGHKRKTLVRSIIVLVLVIAAGAIAVTKFHYVQWRFSATEVREYRGEIDNQNGLAIRLLMWQSALELIKERPVTGYGLKGGATALIDKYREKKFMLGVEGKYHAHNQYLQTLLLSGSVGLALLVAFLVKIAVRATRHKNMLLWIILLHFLCTSVVESTLEIQQEQVFFVFFMLLFYSHFAPPGPPSQNMEQV